VHTTSALAWNASQCIQCLADNELFQLSPRAIKNPKIFFLLLKIFIAPYEL
jgi:hypothetical protein